MNKNNKPVMVKDRYGKFGIISTRTRKTPE